MILYPAIDLLEGRAVRLVRGDRKTAKVYSEDPPAQARAWVAQGARAVHVVDLDAAFGGPRQLELVSRIAEAARPAPVQVGGGVRDLESAHATLWAGAARVIFGTAAAERPSLAGEAVARFGASKVAVGLDVKEGLIATRGWTEASAHAAPDLFQILVALGVRTFIVTSVAQDGMMSGFDLALLRSVSSVSSSSSGDVELIASGGAGDLSHLRALALARIPGVAGAIAGTALYEQRFTVREGEEALAC